MSKSKTNSKKSTKTGEALRKEALAVTGANLARIEAKERGGKNAKPERDTTTLAEFFPRPAAGKPKSASKAPAKGAAKMKAANPVRANVLV